MVLEGVLYAPNFSCSQILLFNQFTHLMFALQVGLVERKEIRVEIFTEKEREGEKGEADLLRS